MRLFLDPVMFLREMEFIRNCRNEAAEEGWLFTKKKISVEAQQEYFTNKVLTHDVKIWTVKMMNNDGSFKAVGYVYAWDFIREKKSCMLGIVIKKEFRGQGIGKEATRRFCEILSKECWMNEICLEVYEFNKGAVRIYQDLGFKQEAFTVINGKKVLIMKKPVWVGRK